MGIVKAIWEPLILCAKLESLFHSYRLQMGIFGFSQKETGAESIAMVTAK